MPDVPAGRKKAESFKRRKKAPKARRSQRRKKAEKNKKKRRIQDGTQYCSFSH